MRLVTYRSGRGNRAGLMTSNGVLDAWDALGVERSSLRELIAYEGLPELEAARGTPLENADALPPSSSPSARSSALRVGLAERE